MVFWGCDACHPRENLLSASGLQRIARTEQGREGSSRYRIEWQGGLVELHSYCVGWYSPETPGIIFIRSLQRFRSCVGPQPLTPGKYERERFFAAGRDQLLHSVTPLVAWITDYERRIAEMEGLHYRRNCWRLSLKKAGARPWLPPDQAVDWFQCFLDCPETTPRARQFSHNSTLHPLASHAC